MSKMLDFIESLMEKCEAVTEQEREIHIGQTELTLAGTKPRANQPVRGRFNTAWGCGTPTKSGHGGAVAMTFGAQCQVDPTCPGRATLQRM